jgi:hypothetical protein
MILAILNDMENEISDLKSDFSKLLGVHTKDRSKLIQLGILFLALESRMIFNSGCTFDDTKFSDLANQIREVLDS